MADSQQQPWSDNPNAPNISPRVYFDEKANFAGYFIGAILYGIIIVLFFQCMAALFDPTNRRGEPVKWGLVSYTMVVFSLATVQSAMNLDIISISYIDNRAFSEGVLPPGPIGYQFSIYTEAISIIAIAIFTLINWLADGLLLYRCYIIYFKNVWAIAFPCLMFLGSIAMGIVLNYQSADPSLETSPWAGIPYYTISLSLNVILTLMIITRLILQARDTRTALGITGIGGLCKAVVTMLVESCALYAVSSLLVIGPWGANNPITNVFLPILNQTQVIAPLLIIRRVADKSTWTNSTLAPGRINPFHAENRGQSTDDSSTLPGGDPTSPVDRYGVGSGEPGVGAETDIFLTEIGGQSSTTHPVA